DAVLRERADDAIDVEVLDREAEVIDRGRGVRRGGTDGEELRPGADAQNRRGALARGDGHAEETLIELDAALRIGHRQRHVVQRADLDRRLRRARDRARQKGEARKREKQLAVSDPKRSVEFYQ